MLELDYLGSIRTRRGDCVLDRSSGTSDLTGVQELVIPCQSSNNASECTIVSMVMFVSDASTFGRGFVEVFVEGWPFLVAAGLLFVVFRRFVLEDRRQKDPVGGPFRPIGGFLGAAVIAILLKDALSSWWLVTLAFVALLVIGTESRCSRARWLTWPPTLAAWGYCVWTGAAPGVSAWQKLALVAVWAAVLAWVLRSLMGIRLARRIWGALGRTGQRVLGVALFLGLNVAFALALADRVWWLLLLLIGLVSGALAVGLLGVRQGPSGSVPRFLGLVLVSGLAAACELFVWAWWCLFAHHMWWPLAACGAALGGVILATVALSRSRKAP